MGDPNVKCGLLSIPKPTDRTLNGAAYVTVGAPPMSVGTGTIPGMPTPMSIRLEGGKPAGPPMEEALAQFQDRAYAVGRVGPGVELTDSLEGTNTALVKAAWKRPRPC